MTEGSRLVGSLPAPSLTARAARIACGSRSRTSSTLSGFLAVPGAFLGGMLDGKLTVRG